MAIVSREGELQGVNFNEFQKKCDCAKTGMPIKMILRGFAANDITNIVLKFGDNRAKVRGVTGGGKFLEKLRKSNHAKTDFFLKLYCLLAISRVSSFTALSALGPTERFQVILRQLFLAVFDFCAT